VVGFLALWFVVGVVWFLVLVGFCYCWWYCECFLRVVREQKLEGMALLQILEEKQECLGRLEIMLARNHSASADGCS
jgi:hypothetical protein